MPAFPIVGRIRAILPGTLLALSLFALFGAASEAAAQTDLSAVKGEERLAHQQGLDQDGDETEQKIGAPPGPGTIPGGDRRVGHV